MNSASSRGATLLSVGSGHCLLSVAMQQRSLSQYAGARSRVERRRTRCRTQKKEKKEVEDNASYLHETEEMLRLSGA